MSVNSALHLLGSLSRVLAELHNVTVDQKRLGYRTEGKRAVSVACYCLLYRVILLCEDVTRVLLCDVSSGLRVCWWEFIHWPAAAWWTRLSGTCLVAQADHCSLCTFCAQASVARSHRHRWKCTSKLLSSLMWQDDGRLYLIVKC